MQEGADELSRAGVMTQNISFFVGARYKTDMKDRLYLYTPCSTGAQALEWLDPWDIMSTGARYPHNTGIPKSQRELEGIVNANSTCEGFNICVVVVYGAE